MGTRRREGPKYPVSKCFSCARASAKPDPKGCAWHRSGHPIFNKAMDKPLGNRGVIATVVTDCSYYIYSDRRGISYEGEEA